MTVKQNKKSTKAKVIKEERFDGDLLNEFSQLVMKLGEDTSKEYLFPFVASEFEKLRQQVQGLLDHIKCGELGEVPNQVQKPITEKLDDISKTCQELKMDSSGKLGEVFQKFELVQKSINELRELSKSTMAQSKEVGDRHTSAYHNIQSDISVLRSKLENAERRLSNRNEEHFQSLKRYNAATWWMLLIIGIVVFALVVLGILGRFGLNKNFFKESMRKTAEVRA